MNLPYPYGPQQSQTPIVIKTVEWFITETARQAFIQNPTLAPTEIFLHASELAAILRDAGLLSTREELAKLNNQNYGSGSLVSQPFVEP